MAEGRRKVNANQLVQDIKAGLTEADLIAKHKVSQIGLQRLLNQCLLRGLITDDDLRDFAGLSKAASKEQAEKNDSTNSSAHSRRGRGPIERETSQDHRETKSSTWTATSVTQPNWVEPSLRVMALIIACAAFVLLAANFGFNIPAAAYLFAAAGIALGALIPGMLKFKRTHWYLGLVITSGLGIVSLITLFSKAFSIVFLLLPLILLNRDIRAAIGSRHQASAGERMDASTLETIIEHMANSLRPKQREKESPAEGKPRNATNTNTTESSEQSMGSPTGKAGGSDNGDIANENRSGWVLTQANKIYTALRNTGLLPKVIIGGVIGVIIILYLLRPTVVEISGGRSKNVASTEKEIADSKHQDGAKTSAKPRVVVSSEDYSIERLGQAQFRLTVKGAVKNASQVDVKNVLVTTDCDGCKTTISPDTSTGYSGWVDASVALKSGRKGTRINYLGAGDREDFQYEVAIMISPYHTERIPDPPTGLKTRVVSFDSAK